MYPVPDHGKGILHASVWDLSTPPVLSTGDGEQVGSDPETSSSSSLPEGIQPGTVDIAVMIFVMSALHPLEWQRAIANAYKVGSFSTKSVASG